MEVKVEADGPCRKALLIEAGSEEIRPEYDSVLKNYARQAKIKGFRPGKAPLDLVEKVYEKSIADDVRERLLPRYYREAVKRTEIVEVAAVDVRKVEFAKSDGLRFEVSVDVAPEFKLPKYEKIAVKRKNIEVGEEMVEQALRQLLESRARFEDAPAERLLQKGDLANLEYEGICEGRPVQEMAPACQGLGAGRDFWVMVDEPEFLPGFNDGLLGAKAGETRSIAVDFPADFREAAVAGQKANYTVTVHKIRERILPVLDEDFLKTLEVASEVELRDKIRENLLAREQADETRRLKEEISGQLLKKADFDLPRSQVEDETRRTARTLARSIASRGGSQAVEQHKEQILASAGKSSAERVRLAYILEKIAAKESIAVSDEERDRALAEMARQYGLTPDKLRAELEKNDGIQRLTRDMLCEKTLDTLLEKAQN